MSHVLNRWQAAVKQLTPLRRHHAGPDMDAAYDDLLSFYPEITIKSFASGQRSGHWEIPPGWVVKSGRLLDPFGEIIADYEAHPLRLFTYSPSFRGVVSLEELQNHLLSDPERPDSIPFHFRNQYRIWDAKWGFCLTENERKRLVPGRYRVEIETEFIDSKVTAAIQTHHGEKKDCFLLVGHFDHPGMAGDGLIGCLAGHEAISRLKEKKTRLTYRMLSTVEIIGSVFYAGQNARDDNVKHALFTALAGVNAPLKYARTAKASTIVDQIISHVLRHVGESSEIVGFREAIGNDEIAFDVESVNIPCGSLMRWPYEHYHTHLDSADKISAERMEEFVHVLLATIHVLENNSIFVGKFEGLPQLAHPDIGLYLSPQAFSGIPEEQNGLAREIISRLPDQRSVNAGKRASKNFNQMMTLIPALADGKHTVLDIAERSEVPFVVVDAYTELWKEKGLLEKSWVSPFASGGKDS